MNVMHAAMTVDEGLKLKNKFKKMKFFLKSGANLEIFNSNIDIKFLDLNENKIPTLRIRDLKEHCDSFIDVESIESIAIYKKGN